MRKAAFGIVGLETSASLTYTELVEGGVLTPMQMAERMSFAPARILGLENKGQYPKERLRIWLSLIRPENTRLIRTRSCPKERTHRLMDGKSKVSVKYTLVDGKLVYKNKAYEEQE